MPRSAPKPTNDESGAVLAIAQAIAAADAGIPGPDERGAGLWPSLGSVDQARYLVMARVSIEAYLAWVGDRRA